MITEVNEEAGDDVGDEGEAEEDAEEGAEEATEDIEEIIEEIVLTDAQLAEIARVDAFKEMRDFILEELSVIGEAQGYD